MTFEYLKKTVKLLINKEISVYTSSFELSRAYTLKARLKNRKVIKFSIYIKYVKIFIIFYVKKNEVNVNLNLIKVISLIR